MSNLTKDQIKSFSEHYGIPEEEVIKHEKLLTQTLQYQWDVLKEQILKIWEGLKPHVIKIVSIYKEYKHDQTLKFYRKKKSQRKKWKKWKRRK